MLYKDKSHLKEIVNLSFKNKVPEEPLCWQPHLRRARGSSQATPRLPSGNLFQIYFFLRAAFFRK